MSATSEPAPSPPYTEKREFWVLMGYAAALGVFGAFMALVFMGVIGFGGGWYADANPGWFGGQWWWVAVTAGAGVVVGLLRRLMRLPEEIPGLIADLKDGHVDPRLVPGITQVTAGWLSVNFNNTCAQLAQPISAAQPGRGLSRRPRSRPPPPNG